MSPCQLDYYITAVWLGLGLFQMQQSRPRTALGTAPALPIAACFYRHTAAHVHASQQAPADYQLSAYQPVNSNAGSRCSSALVARSQSHASASTSASLPPQLQEPRSEDEFCIVNFYHLVDLEQAEEASAELKVYSNSHGCGPLLVGQQRLADSSLTAALPSIACGWPCLVAVNLLLSWMVSSCHHPADAPCC